MNWKNVWIIGLWDLKLTARGRVAFALVLLMPILMILLMGNVMKPYFEMTREAFPHFEVAYYNADEDIQGRAFEEFLKTQGEEYFDLVGTGEEDIERAVLSEEYPAGIIVPRHFSENLEENQGGEIQIIGSGNHPVQEGLLLEMVENYAGITKDKEKKEMSDTGLTSFQYFSASMMVFFLLTSGMGIGGTLIDERNNKTLQRIHAHPVQKREYLFGKMMSNSMIGILQAVIVVAVTGMAFDVQWGSQPFALGVLILLVVFISCALGIIFSSFMPSSGALTAVMTIILWFMSFISGGFTGSPLLGNAQRFTVNHYAFEGMAALMKGGGWGDITGSVMILALTALVLWGIGILQFNRRVSYE